MSAAIPREPTEAMLEAAMALYPKLYSVRELATGLWLAMWDASRPSATEGK